MTSLRVRPSPFSSGDVVAWLKRFDLCASANDSKAEDKPKLLPEFLEGQALAVYDQMDSDDQGNLKKIKEVLQSAFRQPPQVVSTTGLSSHRGQGQFTSSLPWSSGPHTTAITIAPSVNTEYHWLGTHGLGCTWNNTCTTHTYS